MRGEDEDGKPRRGKMKPNLAVHKIVWLLSKAAKRQIGEYALEWKQVLLKKFK